MSRLLVSVRNAAEAQLAAAAGVDLIDVKEPARGSLGAADWQTVVGVVVAVAGRAPVSVALGELLEVRPAPLAAAWQGIHFAKLGLAGCGKLDDWPQRWRQALDALPSTVGRVAVVYADHLRAAAPPAGAILPLARQLGCCAVLVDTFDKQSGSLLDHWSLVQVGRFIDQAQRRRLRSVVAGSLLPPSIAAVLPLHPDFVAVRGAACERGRTGDICSARLNELCRLLRAASRGTGEMRDAAAESAGGARVFEQDAQTFA